MLVELTATMKLTMATRDARATIRAAVLLKPSLVERATLKSMNPSAMAVPGT